MGYLDEEVTSIDARDDEEILQLSLSHPSQFAILVEKYEDAFMRKALRILHAPEDAEDAVQEAFTKIYMYAPRFKKQEGATFSSWGYKILINTCLTKYQKKKKDSGARIDLDPEFYEMLPDGVDTKGERELRDEIASILVRIPQGFADALTKHFIDGKAHAEVAEEEGISEGAIKTRVHRAKREFKRVYDSLKTTEETL